MLEDYLCAEQLIIERLRQQIPDLRAVLAAADLADLTEAQQTTPAVHVIYDGDRLGDSAGRGAGQMVYQRWLTVVTVRSARGQRSGAGAREVAGPIITEVIQSLAGWAPSDAHQPLVRVSAPRPHYSAGGYAYIPLAWETRIVT